MFRLESDHLQEDDTRIQLYFNVSPSLHDINIYISFRTIVFL